MEIKLLIAAWNYILDLISEKVIIPVGGAENLYGLSVPYVQAVDCTDVQMSQTILVHGKDCVV